MPVIGYEHTNRVTVNTKRINVSADTKVQTKIKELLDILILERPLWEFQLGDPDYTGAATSFTILQDGEELGHVSWRWKLGQMRYSVFNDRISESMSRGNGYATKDVSKAALKIKKMFSQATNAEKTKKAAESARMVMRNAVQRKDRELYQLRNAVNESMMVFVHGAGLQMYMEHVSKHRPIEFNTLRKRDEVQGEVDEIKKLNAGYISDNSTLVVREGSVYIVKSKNGTHVHTDATLPAYIPPKLGMLKLVENEHYVSGIGIRVDENIFVVDGYERTDEQLQGVADNADVPTHTS